MDIAYEYAKFVESVSSYVLGTDLFIGNLPDNVQNGIYIERLGGLPDMYTPMARSVLDVIVVDTQSKDAVDTLQDILTATHRMIDTQPTANSQIYSMLVIGDIESQGRDIENQAMYKFTVEIYHKDNGLIS